ncbi:GNAT family N-acetyltransferase [Virgisporangium aliadipatigenens]
MSTDIRRDVNGIPYLWGDTADELAFAQGHNAATDRAWQIEVERWRSEGALAARLGAGEVAWDRFARRARLDDTARRCYERLDADTRRWIASYVDGVNAGLREADAPEFAATGSAPGTWRPWTPLGVFLVQHILFGTFTQKLWRAHVGTTLGTEAVALFHGEPPAGSGSNAWVAGERPYLAGDPHRVLELPGVYQQVGLACPEFDVVGFAFPGVPGVPHFGHAGSVAWSITNAMADYQDLYVEEIVDGRARGASGWEPVTVHSELIQVRDGDPVPVEIVQTARGPVIDTGLSLRTPCRVEERLGFEALLPLLRARTAGDVLAALEHWVEPVNSVLVVDSAGAAHWRVAGLVPERDDANRRTPVPAWAQRHAWRGYAPTPGGAVEHIRVNANDARPGDTADLGVDFAAPHRARRIRELLDAGAEPTAVHTDTLLDTTVLSGLLRRLPASPTRDRLLAWDGQLRADSVEAGAYALWRNAFARRVASHSALVPLRAAKSFDRVFDPWLHPGVRVGLALDGVVANAHVLPALAKDLEELAAAALDEVTEAGEWGATHVLAPVRTPHDAPGLPHPVPVSGDEACVLSTTSVPGVSDACWRGPVARYVWRLDGTPSEWVVPFGASGRPDDPHFADQTPLWTAGELLPVVRPWTVTYEERVAGLGTFRLEPLVSQLHLDLVYGWVTQPRAEFWGMTEHTREYVGEIYDYIADLPSHHAYLMRVDGRPVGIFQTYEPEHDPVGEVYPVRDGDFGIHLFLAPPEGAPVAGFTGALTGALHRFVFAVPSRRRIVIEPDVRNERALRRWRRSGYEFGEQVDVNGKRAQLAFFDRPDTA